MARFRILSVLVLLYVSFVVVFYCRLSSPILLQASQSVNNEMPMLACDFPYDSKLGWSIFP